MRYKPLSKIFTALLLAVIYCTTIPLLSVVHTHERVNGTGVVTFGLSGKESSTKEIPLFCEVCFRLSTTVMISPQAFVLPAVHPGYEVVFRTPESGFRFDRHIYLQGRAPPFDLA